MTSDSDFAGLQAAAGILGVHLLKMRGFTPARLLQLHETWLDPEDGNIRTDRKGASPIELAWYEYGNMQAVLVFRPKDKSIGFDLADKARRDA